MKKLLSIILVALSINATAQQVLKPVFPVMVDTSKNIIYLDSAWMASLASVSTVNAVAASVAATNAKAKVDSAMFAKLIAAGTVQPALTPLTITASYTLKSTDAGRLIIGNCAGCTLTLPTLTVPFECPVYVVSGYLNIVYPSTGRPKNSLDACTLYNWYKVKYSSSTTPNVNQQ